MDFKFWWYFFTRCNFKAKLVKIQCLFGKHDPVYGIYGLNRYHVKCYHCNKVLDDGEEY